MSVFYKFKSALTFDTIQFDDLHISLQEFKKAVIHQKQLGKNTNFDLQVTNAETNEVYSEENSLIPKNSSLIVVRIPLVGSQKKPWDAGDQFGSKVGIVPSDYLQENAGNIVVKSADLAALNASEDDKIQAMMFQSTVDYDPSNYLRVKGGSQYGDPPPAYICHKCHNPGHWIKDCPITIVPDIKKSSGIPQSFMTPVDGPSVPGALMTPAGTFAVPTIDMHAYKEGKIEKPFISSEETCKPVISEDLLCTLCQDLLTDAVMMPCCGNSFCDECIRNVLLESEENQCPDCNEKDTSPETLIPNRFLRNAVNNFRNKTGYRGGGQRVKQKETEPARSPIIDQDVEIIATIPVESALKSDYEPERDKGSAISVVGSDKSHRGARIQTNGTQMKMPNIHLEHRPPLGRPITLQSDVKDPQQRKLVGNRMNSSSPDTIINVDCAKSSPAVVNVSHTGSVVLQNPPNTSQLPPGYNQQTMQPVNTHFTNNAPPMIPSTYGPPPNLNPMILQQQISSQPPVRMYTTYSNAPVYASQIGGGYRSGPGSRVRMHPDGYSDQNIVEDPLEAFQRHLREREKQDRMRRRRNRRSRSRSISRGKSRSISRSVSRSRSPSVKRSHSRSPLPMRRESSLKKRDSRTPPLSARRSKSKSRSRTRLRTRSRSHPRNSIPRSGSHSPKKKRSVSLSPSLVSVQKRACTPSPMKKSLRSHRTRSRTRSKSISRLRKRRRSRTRSRSVSSRRSISRGRSYSRSLSPPRGRSFYSPNFNSHRGKRHSRSPFRYHSTSRHRGGNYRDHSPHLPYFENEYRGYRRGFKNPRYARGNSRYMTSASNYESNKYDRYSNAERYEDKRYLENSNGRGYFTGNNEHSRNRKETYYPPSTEHYVQYNSFNNEVAPPGTTDMIPTVGYTSNYVFDENSSGYVDRSDKYRSLEYEEENVFTGHSNLRDLPAAGHDEWKKTKDYNRDKDKDNSNYYRKSRDKHHNIHHSEYEKDSRRHDSRSRYTSLSPSSSRNTDRKHKSHGRSRDKENRPSYVETVVGNKRDSIEKHVEYSDRNERELVEVKKECSPKKEKSSKKDDDDKKDEYRDKKEKSKRKKKRESESEKKKKKKIKSGKKDEELQWEDKSNEKEKEPKGDIINDADSKTVERENVVVGEFNDDAEHTSVDSKFVENYDKIDKLDDEEIENKNIIMAAVPELSKWERDDVSSPSEEQKNVMSKICESNDKKLVTNEILKRAENVLFQKATKVSSRSADLKIETISSKEKEEIQSTEGGAREAKKSGNSIQVTVAAVSSNVSEDEDRSFPPTVRISAKDRLGAKVEEKSYTTIRSLVEPKMKLRSLQSTVKSVVDVKLTSKVDHHKHDDSKSKRHNDRKRKDNSHQPDVKHSKHRDSKESKDKSKHTRKVSEEEIKTKKNIIREKPGEKEKISNEEAKKDENKRDGHETAQLREDDNLENRSTIEDKPEVDKKRPSIDESNFEPDYDLTESEEETEKKNNAEEPNKQIKTNENGADLSETTKQTIDKSIIQKIIERAKDLSSSESSSGSSSDSSVQRKKHKKKKSKKKRKLKKRRAAYSSDSDSDESSDSDSDSDAKRKHKKKHKHKSKKSKTGKKKKKSKHKS